MGHYDVVPVIQGTERLWKHKPFAAEIADGFLYGRGTLDDKVTVIGILEAPVAKRVSTRARFLPRLWTMMKKYRATMEGKIAELLAAPQDRTGIRNG